MSDIQAARHCRQCQAFLLFPACRMPEGCVNGDRMFPIKTGLMLCSPAKSVETLAVRAKIVLFVSPFLLTKLVSNMLYLSPSYYNIRPFHHCPPAGWVYCRQNSLVLPLIPFHSSQLYPASIYPIIFLVLSISALHFPVLSGPASPAYLNPLYYPQS